MEPVDLKVSFLGWFLLFLIKKKNLQAVGMVLKAVSGASIFSASSRTLQGRKLNPRRIQHYVSELFLFYFCLRTSLSNKKNKV